MHEVLTLTEKRRREEGGEVTKETPAKAQKQAEAASAVPAKPSTKTTTAEAQQHTVELAQKQAAESARQQAGREPEPIDNDSSYWAEEARIAFENAKVPAYFWTDFTNNLDKYYDQFKKASGNPNATMEHFVKSYVDRFIDEEGRYIPSN